MSTDRLVSSDADVWKIARRWEHVWRNASLGEWDGVSERIYLTLCKEILRTRTQLLLEAGSGTGRISGKLKEEGKGEVLLLDVSKTAIQRSKEMFEKRDLNGSFAVGSIFQIPIRNSICDVVWNAGVLEHFLEVERTLAIAEMVRVCKDRGLVITFNPFSNAVLYRIGKWYAEKTNKWIYGYEKPITSIKEYVHDKCSLVAEYSVDFDTTIDFLSFVQLPSAHARACLISLLRHIYNRLPSSVLDRFGYLLVSVARKV